MTNRIEQPFTKGDKVVIPAGTPFWYRGEIGATRRQQTITVHHTFNGWIDTSNDLKRGRGYVRLPQITYPGSGGYWKDIQVTAELLAANDREPLTLPELTERDHYGLDVIPSLDAGYTDQWKTPAAPTAAA